ncbi:MFS transporter [Virgibacillus ainsalahensis]
MEIENPQPSENDTSKTPKLKMREKLTFGLGDFGANYSWTFIASFITIYMTDTVGIAAGVIGTIILLARVTDGFSDLFMGTIIDNTKAKMGKAKPWVFWTAPILGILTFMLFNVPDWFGQTGKVVYVFSIYFLISTVFYTANNVAYSSLTSFMTNDKEDRVALGSIRFIFANIAVLSITTFTTFLVDGFGGGQQGWTITAAIYGLLCALPLMATGWFTKERNVAKKVNENQKTSFVPILKVLFTDKYFILALVLYLLWYLRQTENGIRVFYATYIFDNPDVMGLLSMAALLPMIIGLFFAPKIAGKYGVKKSVNAGLIISIIAYAIMIIFPENLTMLVIGLAVNAVGLVPLQAALSAIVADVGDLVYWKSGVPVQGSVFSLTSAGMKIGSGVQSAIVGWSLSIGGYIAGASIQPDGATLAMKTMLIYFPLAMVVLMFITVAALNYEKFIPKIREEIQKGNVGEFRNKHVMKD